MRLGKAVQVMVFLSGLAGSGMAGATSLEGGTWRCQRPDTPDNIREWTTYHFNHDGTIHSQEWVQTRQGDEIALDFTMTVDYQLSHNGKQYVLKPVWLQRNIKVDRDNLNPFDADALRDLLGYRIFFEPEFGDENHARFEMRHHITPNQRFILHCSRQI